MIGQFIFFALFFITLFAGFFVYLSPKQHTLSPMPLVMGNSEYDPSETENSSTKEYQQLNMTTIKGIVQIHKQIDQLTQEQKKLMEAINDDQQTLSDTNKRLSDVLDQVKGSNDIDAIKLKVLGLQLQNDQRLLVARGQSLIAFNNQLTKSRQWLLQESRMLNDNSEESLRMLEEHDASLNDQSAEFFDKIAEKNNDLIEHSKVLIDEEHQKVEDQQDR